MEWLTTSLRLGRAAGLPTVWSNVLAGWWLGGGGTTREMPMLLLGVSCLYLGATFLNDAFDEPFDREHRRYHPIPSGSISGGATLRLGWTWLVCGVGACFWCGLWTGVYSLACVCALLVFNLTHRAFAGAALFLGVCRLALYLSGAAISMGGVTGWSVWCGTAAGLYVIGARLFETVNRSGEYLKVWPLLLVLAPPALALILNTGPYREPALLLCAVLALWLAMSLRHTWWTENPDFDKTTPGLQAGIILVDWLAVADAPRSLSAVFIVLFLLTVMVQRLPVMPGAASAHGVSQ